MEWEEEIILDTERERKGVKEEGRAAARLGRDALSLFCSLLADVEEIIEEEDWNVSPKKCKYVFFPGQN